MIFATPAVPPLEQCNLFEADGTRCPNQTGSSEPGIDADLCPEHRAQFAAQREDT